MKMVKGLVGASIVLALAVLLVATQGGKNLPPRPDVVLMTMDTLRADSLGCYGRVAAGTPNFDRLAHEGILFENAVAPMPITRASHFSIMTSLFPRQHGVMSNAMSLPQEVLTLPEVFRAAGYSTVGAVSVGLLGADSGAAQGFDTFDAPVAVPRWPGSEALSRAAGALHRLPSGQPAFVWLHVFEPHIPYVSHRGPEPAEISWPLLLDAAARNDGAITAETFERARQFYQDDVSEADRVLGALLQLLDERRRPTVLAVTADHGECFENGVFFEHASCLYEGAIRVPLVLRYPNRLQPGRRRGQVELRHLGSTLLSLAGVGVPQVFDRGSLLAATDAPAFFESPLYPKGTADALGDRYARIRVVAGKAVRPFLSTERQLGVRWHSWKYLTGPRGDELFDLSHDAAEGTNLVRTRPDMAGQMERLISTWTARYPMRPRDIGAVSPELREMLRALGYAH